MFSQRTTKSRFPLLAGPIVRRAEATRICIWVATEAPALLQFEIYSIEQDKTAVRRAKPIKPFETPIGFGIAQSVQLGARLHVHLAEVRPVGAPRKQFPVGKLLAYDIKDLSKPAGSPRLRDVAREECLVYEDRYSQLPLPSLVLQDPSDQLHALQASCRKLHAAGADALLSVERKLDQWALNPRLRPSALFLTGDQIYADEVSGILIKHLTALGERLTGRQEEIEGLRLRGHPIRPRDLKIGGRDQAIKESTVFSSNEAGNHLLTFGEYAALYLLSFNEQNWPSLLTAPPDMKKLKGELQNLRETLRTLPKVRRLLANIPTYMIFDDHEVTDDWNFNAEWRKEAEREHRAGRRIIANALAAFWAFQGWGNNPESYDKKSFIDPIERHLRPPSASGAASDEFERTLWSFKRWSFHAPTRPPAFFMDTRTRRGATVSLKGANPKTAPPRLIDDSAWNDFKKIIREEAKHLPGEPLILIAPTPVFSLDVIDLIQQLSQISYRSFTFLDAESWRANDQNIGDLFRFLFQLGPQPCIILSGDVHFATAAAATLQLLDPSTEPEARRGVVKIAQLTSSAAKNPDSHLIANAIPILQLLSVLAEPPTEAGTTTRHWWHNGPVVQSFTDRQFGELLMKRGPSARERIRFNGGSLPETLFDNNVGQLITDGKFVDHSFLTADGNKHIVVRFELNKWPSE